MVFMFLFAYQLFTLILTFYIIFINNLYTPLRLKSLSIFKKARHNYMSKNTLEPLCLPLIVFLIKAVHD